jgi:hypothetical protein
MKYAVALVVFLSVVVGGQSNGADRVVVARVFDVRATWETNIHGDQLIVSHLKLHVEETLKGAPEKTVEVDVLGGTLDGLTLEVSDEPRLKRGDRAVFFLPQERDHPQMSSWRVLKLDAQNRVEGSTLDLPAIKKALR